MGGKRKYKSGSEIVEKSFLRNLSKEDLETKIREQAYLGILTKDETLFNPLLDIPMFAHDNFDEYLVYLMSQPEYFYFIIKVLFGMQTFPMQMLILKELYEHRFPILMMSRGGGKCVAPDTMVITNNGIRQIKELVPNDNVGELQKFNGSLLGENKYTPVKYSFYNGEKSTKIIKTRSGRKIEATHNHPIRVVSDGEIVWKNAEDIKVGDFLPVVRGVEEWNYNNLHKDIAYMIGAYVGDGCYTRKSGALGFSNEDQECVENVRKGLLKWNKDLTLRTTNSTTRKHISHMCSGGKAIKNKFMEDFGINHYNGYEDKITPKIIFSASHKSISNYLQGLFDTDGCCITGSPVVEFSTKSEQLVRETQFLLMCLGINSNIKLQYNKIYKKNYYKLHISGSSLRIFKDKVGFRISRKQALLNKHCLRTINDNVDLIPKELICDKLLLLRELARDTKISNGTGYDYSRQLISPHRIKTYSLSYESFGKALDILSKSESVKYSKEYSDLCDIYNTNYYYDKVKSIDNGLCKTYDVELVDDHSFISNGFISHNTFSLGMYILIKMIVSPGVKVVITGAGFRQAKLVFEVMETIWNKATMLRNCFKGAKNGPFHGTDSWTFRLGDSICYALPVGHDGSKVRGYRANCLGGETLIKTEIGEIPIKDYLINGSPKVFNMKNELEQPSKFLTTELTDVYEIITDNNKIKCSKIHRLYTPDGWRSILDIKSGDLVYGYYNDKFYNEPVRVIRKLDLQDILYDFEMPETHSFLGGGFINHNCLVADEFATLSRNVFEEVMSGFLSVSSDNIAQIKQNAFIKTKKDLGLILHNTDKDSGIIQNQLILSGTAYYKHNHFYEYFKKWSEIISSKGDLNLIKNYINDGEEEDFNYGDYCIIRVPIQLIQSGHMDMAQINRIKVSVNNDIWLREYNSCFSDDSDGFYKRSLINHCTISKDNPITKDSEQIKFSPSIFGRKHKKHVYGVDPAYQGDNFAIVILEINDSHRRVVHCWTTQASDHKQRLKDGIITENNYYQYCVRKIRDLMKRFPCAYIALDKGGGGVALQESFWDTAILRPGEVPILPVIDPTEKPQDTDFMEGEHILHIIKPTSEWNTEANHSLKRDMETRDIIFPFHDEISYVEAEFYDPIFVEKLGESSILYDTLEDCMSEIEELKNELSTITISETSTGKEHFDTPEKKTSGMKKGRLKKDRYSALLMANMVARNAENLIVRPLNTMENAMEAYFGSKKESTLFLGNGPIAEKLNALYT